MFQKEDRGSLPEPTEAAARRRRTYLALEFTFLFIILPTIYSRFHNIVHPLPILWGIAAICVYLLRRDGFFKKYLLWWESPTPKQVLGVIMRFVLFAAIITLFTVLYEPASFLTFPGTKPRLWLTILVLYPFLSAVPQGIIYRLFFCHRYSELFGKGWMLIASGGLVFCYAHIFYQNPIAVVLTLAGGIMFLQTYMKSSSFWFSSMEHAMYGNFIFTIGLGHYLFSGAIIH